ncbi:DUF2059 domain-containing protein [Actibacterium mucosum]|nr:DUF2059 domain-containing protein [Actibacterium mucosum]
MRTSLFSVACVAGMLWANIAHAVGAGDVLQALRFSQIAEILAEEGQGHGQSIQDQMFPGRGGPSWEGVVGTIYDADRLQTEMQDALAVELSEEDMVAIIEFFQGETGAQFVVLEEEARRAMMDDAADEAARATYAQMAADEDPRVDILRKFIEVNNLVDLNVANALNANFAFYRGLEEGGVPLQMGEEDMLREVWSQEADIRADTTEWVFSYLALAYAPANDADLQSYIDFSQSPAGRSLNIALFAGFDRSFSRVSREMGFAAARFMDAGEDI